MRHRGHNSSSGISVEKTAGTTQPANASSRLAATGYFLHSRAAREYTRNPTPNASHDHQHRSHANGQLGLSSPFGKGGWGIFCDCSSSTKYRLVSTELRGIHAATLPQPSPFRKNPSPALPVLPLRKGDWGDARRVRRGISLLLQSHFTKGGATRRAWWGILPPLLFLHRTPNTDY